jgi:hypothetical protein
LDEVNHIYIKEMIFNLFHRKCYNNVLEECIAFRFNQQNKEVRFGSYVFGPVVMRMYYFLNKPDEALQVSDKLWTWTSNN